MSTGINPHSNREHDKYLVCSAYEQRIKDSVHPKHKDAIIFQHSDDFYYFATLTDTNTIALRSEGYPTEGARDVGLKSVIRNREKRQRFSVKEEQGLFYTCLIAQNSQEVGRSCPQRTEAAAMALWPALGKAALAAQAAREADAAAAAARANQLAATAAAAVPAAAATSAAASGYKPNADREQDNYLVCSLYEARIADSKHDKHADVLVFQHANGLYYFATLTNNNTEIALRSEGYPSEGARDVGLKSVLRNREKRQRFKLEQKRGLYFTCLTAQNSQEIGRSCPKRDEGAAMLLWPSLGAASMAAQAARDATPQVPQAPAAPAAEDKQVLGAAATTAAATTGLATALTGNSGPVATTPPVQPEALGLGAEQDREDDYLICKEYKNRKMNDRVNRVSLFKHKNGQYYFSILDQEGNIRLRSEAFGNAKQRDEELSGALRFIDDETKYTRITRGNYHVNVLHDETGREVGRSCPSTKAMPFIPIFAVAAAAAVSAAPIAAAVTTPPVVVPPPAAKVKPVPPPPPPAAKRSGCAWWMWVLALLLLGFLIWFFLRGCNATGGAPDATDDTSIGATDIDANAGNAIDLNADAAAVAAQAELDAAAALAASEAKAAADRVAADKAAEDARLLAAANQRNANANAASLNEGECGGIAAGATYTDLGVPLMPMGNFGGLAGDVQRYLRDDAQGARSFSLSNVAFMAPGNDLAIEPCSVGDVDRLAAVLRDNPGARLTVSAPAERDCQTLRRLLYYRGVDRSRITLSPSSANELTITP